jgi:hypothetical protein
MPSASVKHTWYARSTPGAGNGAQSGLRRWLGVAVISHVPPTQLLDLMTGFLDPSAPSTSAEYARYIDGDLLGKLITRNLLINRLGCAPSTVFIPLGRYGDAKVKYAEDGAVTHDLGDGHIEIGSRRITFEIKCARINIANRTRGDTSENWAFVNLLHSPGKAFKSYHVLVAVGVRTLGLEDENYWHHLEQVHARLRADGHSSNIDALPHEAEFLSLCSFFILPRTEIPTNYFRINVDSVSKSRHAQYRAWGHDEPRCKEVWTNAMHGLDGV